MDLRSLYNDPSFSGSFSGKQAFYEAVKKRYPQAKRSEVYAYLKSDDGYTLHKPVQKPKKYRRVYTKHINYLWQLDLSDMSSMAAENDGYKWICNCICTFSKKVYGIALKDKRATTVVNALKPLLTRYKPCKIETDGGTEFKNRLFTALLRKLNIQTYNIHSIRKNSIVERVQRTLKGRMYRAFTARGNYKWRDILQKIISGYNKSRHRMTKFAPNEINSRNQAIVRRNLFPREKRPRKGKLAVGDSVRITRQKSVFQKGFEQTYSYEIFQISKVKPTNPVTYEIEDLTRQTIKGSFYESELQLCDKSNNIYPIEKIVQKRRRNGTLQYLVKFMGYSDLFNAWVDQVDLFKL